MKVDFIRAICMILSLSLLFSICGCGNKPIEEEVIYEYEYESGSGNGNAVSADSYGITK